MAELRRTSLVDTSGYELLVLWKEYHIQPFYVLFKVFVNKYAIGPCLLDGG